MTTPRRPRLLRLALATALAIGLGVGPVARAAGPGSFVYDLYGADDFSSQATKLYCVAGAMQTMTNIMSPGADHGRAGQDRLYELAASLRDRGDGAIGPIGWARALERAGFHRYVVRVYPDLDAALGGASLAVRRTGRPAGLIAWRGVHAWVLHGFRATGDPLLDPSAEVTAWAISDPWYPRVSSIWGRSQPPDTFYGRAYVARHFLPWTNRSGRAVGWTGRFLVVEPAPPLGHWWRLA